MIPAGKRDRYVTIERATVVQDEVGQPIATWTAWKHAWMAKREFRAEERFRSNQEITAKTAVWISEPVVGLLSDDRLSYDGTVYAIQGAPIELERGGGIEITTEAVRI